MNGEGIYKLLKEVESKVEKRTAKICILLASQHEHGKDIAKDIAEKFGIEILGSSDSWRCNND